MRGLALTKGPERTRSGVSPARVRVAGTGQ